MVACLADLACIDFYIARIAGTSIDLDEARTAAENVADPPDVTRSVAEPSPRTADASDEEPRMLSLAELTELIEQGKTDEIPNNRKIPNDLSVCTPLSSLPPSYSSRDLQTEPPSVSIAPIRKKPWEK